MKREAGKAAVEYVRNGHVVGLGTGSTARHVIVALGERVRAGMKISGVATSHETARLAQEHGIPLVEDDEWCPDIAIDGADQVDPELNLIKGGGGALLKEKIVAGSARQFIVVVDDSKCVGVLGHPFPLPVEVVPFGWGCTARKIESLGWKADIRVRDGQYFKTEAGHYILDLHIDRIDDPQGLEGTLNAIPGVVETGLFVDRTDVLIIGGPEGVTVRTRPATRRG
jgi:ribose 5-phosphate isomerase A